MGIESIIESPAFSYTLLASGQITSIVGDKTLTVAGATWPAGLAANGLVGWMADNGQMQFGVVASITDPNNLEMNLEAVAAAGGAAANTFYVVTAAGDYFQANQSYNRVAAYQGTGVGVLETNSGKSKISWNEGILIKSIYIRLPYQFTFADTYIAVSIGSRNGASGSLKFVSQIGEGDGIFNLPIENVEIPVNVYVPPDLVALPVNEFWQIGANIEKAQAGAPGAQLDASVLGDRVTVSTVSMDSALEGNLLPITIGMRILHAEAALTA